MAAREGLAEEEGERTVEEARVGGSLPDRPFTDLNDFLQFERSLESDDALQNVIRTIGTVNTAQSSKEWVNNSWHLVLSDDVGSLCSWTGIRDKQCIRDLRIALAMRRAFVRKFGREEEFVEKTQLFFRGAQYRVKKGPIRCKAKPSIANRLRSTFVTSEILGVPGTRPRVYYCRVHSTAPPVLNLFTTICKQF
ncbi:hypothetical protein ACLKA7_007736 [Drosophila subpalustris]